MTEEKKPWRAEMPGVTWITDMTIEQVRLIVTRANSELDARDARNTELEKRVSYAEEVLDQTDRALDLAEGNSDESEEGAARCPLRVESLTRERDEALARAEKAEEALAEVRKICRRESGLEIPYHEVSRPEDHSVMPNVTYFSDTLLEVIAGRALVPDPNPPKSDADIIKALEVELADRKKYDEDVRTVARAAQHHVPMLEILDASERLLATPYWKGGE